MLFVKKEVPMNFLTDPRDGRSTLKSAGVLVYGWVGVKHVYVDLIVVSLMVRLRTRVFTMRQTTLKAASSKVVKHDKTYFTIYMFSYHLPLIFLVF